MNLSSTPRPLVIAQEINKGAGEDAYTVTAGVSNKNVCMGVFDGCGGLGSKSYPCFNDHTGAWVASRLLACVSEMFFRDYNGGFNKTDRKNLHDLMYEALSNAVKASNDADSAQLGGDLKKNFPSTASIAVADESTENEISVTYVWAGDSRGYFLDNKGLCQVTYDDIEENGDDAFLNLSEDGRLTNVANADDEFELHVRKLRITVPAIIITATDGCFAYFETPMDFEYLLLYTLMCSDTPADWTENIRKRIEKVAGDDFTMLMGIFGFSDFEKVKSHFAMRFRFLKQKFIDQLDDTDPAELWEEYKENYYRRGLSWN